MREKLGVGNRQLYQVSTQILETKDQEDILKKKGQKDRKCW